MATKNLTVLLTGMSNSGKTCYIHRLKTGNFTSGYIATRGVQESTLEFNTNKGVITFTIRDCGGQDELKTNVGEAKSTDAAIILFDQRMSSLVAAKSTAKYIFENVGNIPMIVCRNKIDVGRRRFDCDIPEYDLTKCDISVKSLYNHQVPFLTLMRKFYGDDTEILN